MSDGAGDFLLAVQTASSSVPPPVPGTRLTAQDAIGSPGDWLTVQDYPPTAMRAGEEGRVGFNVSINETGRVYACFISASSGSPTLDERTCALMRLRARFKPGSGLRFFSSGVVWKMPDPVRVVELGAINAMMVSRKSELTIGQDGVVKACRTVDGGADDPDSACRITPIGTLYPARFTRDGKLVEASVTVDTSVTAVGL